MLTATEASTLPGCDGLLLQLPALLAESRWDVLKCESCIIPFCLIDGMSMIGLFFASSPGVSRAHHDKGPRELP